jgi:AcrR family transcriptional regulator
MSPRPKRRESTSELPEKIITAAWDQIKNEGAAALSLRSIARSLSITAPAIYNYYPDRDALVTAMIIEAFGSLADHQAKAIFGYKETDHTEKLMALGFAYRDWALKFPERYQLIFGTPIAGYVAPADVTMPVAARSLLPLMRCLQSEFIDGQLSLDEKKKISENLSMMYSNWRKFLQDDFNDQTLYLTIVIWAKVHGLVSLEISNQFPVFITDASLIFSSEIKGLVSRVIHKS